MAMPENKNIRQQRRLEEMKAALERELKERNGIVIEPAADPLDQILSLVDREFNLENLHRSAQRYQAIVKALRRIKDGSYGICMECDERIPPVRLKAVPWASMCVACQERAERAHSHDGEGFEAAA